MQKKLTPAIHVCNPEFMCVIPLLHIACNTLITAVYSNDSGIDLYEMEKHKTADITLMNVFYL